MADIALSVGYATPSAFSASFRKVVGATPFEYRRRYVFAPSDVSEVASAAPPSPDRSETTAPPLSAEAAGGKSHDLPEALERFLASGTAIQLTG